MAAIDRAMARWLKRRGWVVFWLDEPARHCGISKPVTPCVNETGRPTAPHAHDGCWLALYEAERKAGR